mmetsp:Transcript_16428/g.36478  ORF Transcript_16428/g.36478 Transcript_16428/m.36478 type:complete len:280 (-) Transcript_16428:271-1110(-)
MATAGRYRPARRTRNLVSAPRGTNVIPNANSGMKRGGQCSPNSPAFPKNKPKVSFGSLPDTPRHTSRTKNASSTCTYSSVPNSGGGAAAAAIPFPSSHIPRTKSELQLHEDTAAAEWADMCMFHRLVTGIRERQHVILESEHRAQTATVREQRQDRFGDRQLLHPNTRPRIVRPAPTVQTERCIDSIISTRHNRAVSLEDMTTSTTKDESSRSSSKEDQLSTRGNLLSTLNTKGGHEDWSLEGFEDKGDAQQDPRGSHQDDDNVENDDLDDGGIFSLDL